MLKWEMGAELPRNSLSVAKEGKVFEQKKLLQPLLGTPEGTKMTGTIFFLTSPTLTVYSTVQSSPNAPCKGLTHSAGWQGAPNIKRKSDTAATWVCMETFSVFGAPTRRVPIFIQGPHFH